MKSNSPRQQKQVSSVRAAGRVGGIHRPTLQKGGERVEVSGLAVRPQNGDEAAFGSSPSRGNCSLRTRLPCTGKGLASFSGPRADRIRKALPRREERPCTATRAHRQFTVKMSIGSTCRAGQVTRVSKCPSRPTVHSDQISIQSK